MKIQRLKAMAGVASVWLAVIAAVFSGVVWALDTRYPTHGLLDIAFNKFRLSLINDSIWEIETKIQLGEASKVDQVKLDRQKRQREELLQ